MHKVSIIPRGTAALGYTLQMPLQDRYIMSKKELVGRLIVLLGGRASEELVFNEVTTGAHNDLEVATQSARRMVCEYGMSETLGHLTFGRRQQQVFLGRDMLEERDYSEQTAVIIDKEVRKIVDESYAQAKKLLSDNTERLKKLAETLLDREVMESGEVLKILGFPARETSATAPAVTETPGETPAGAAAQL